MADIAERLQYRAETLWTEVRPHAAILDLEAAAYIRQLEKLVEDAFFEGYGRGFTEGFYCEDNPGMPCEDQEEFEAWSKEREKNHSVIA